MRPFSLSILSVSALLAMAGFAHAQQAPRIDVTAKVAPIQTPMFQVGNVPNKVWRPRNWMELDVDMQAKGIHNAGRGDFLPSVEVKVYISFQTIDPTTKLRNGVSGTFNVQNVPEHSTDHSHLLVYLAPAMIYRMIGKPDFTNGDIAGIAVEVSHDGKVVGGYAAPNVGRWWEGGKVNLQEGLLPKVKTPFAPLWGDYDLEVK